MFDVFKDEIREKESHNKCDVRNQFKRTKENRVNGKTKVSQINADKQRIYFLI